MPKNKKSSDFRKNKKALAEASYETDIYQKSLGQANEMIELCLERVMQVEKLKALKRQLRPYTTKKVLGFCALTCSKEFKFWEVNQDEYDYEEEVIEPVSILSFNVYMYQTNQISLYLVLQ